MGKNITPSVVCFGEVLWDIFPDGEKAGGAPFNVAYNLKKQNVNSFIISRVGNDTLGRRLIKQISDWVIPTSYCQTDNVSPTGTVLAKIDEFNEAHYDIQTSVAWDFIDTTEENRQLVSSSSAFVYGSLVTRAPKSASTLFELLNTASYCVFDINLRPPFFSVDLLKRLLEKANMVKTNNAELRQILDLLGIAYESEDESVKILRQLFDVDSFLLTKGSKGAVYYDKEQALHFDALPVTINDTVGSGDSFLAGFLAAKVQGKTIIESMYNASAMGAFITTKSGACPSYDLYEFVQFKKEHLITI